MDGGAILQWLFILSRGKHSRIHFSAFKSEWMLPYLMKGSSTRTGELKEGGLHFFFIFPFEMPVPESSDINRKFGRWIISWTNPIAASPDWWEVIRGNPEAARRAMPFRQAGRSQLRPQAGFLQVPSVALQLMPENSCNVTSSVASTGSPGPA